MVFEFLKLQHLLLDMDEGILKISDLELGCAYTMPLKSYTHEIATLWYRTSEVLSVPLTTPQAPIGGPLAYLVSTLTLILSLISYGFNFMRYKLVSLIDHISIRFMNV